MPGIVARCHGRPEACGKLPSVQELSIEVPTAQQRLSDARPALDRALAELVPSGLLQSRWEDESLHLSGPGASATVTLEEGRLVGRARLEPPASMMRGMIEEKMTDLLRAAAAPGDG